MPQALFIRNDEELLAWIDRPDGWITELSQRDQDTLDSETLVVEAYLRTLSRRPTEDELREALTHLSGDGELIDHLRDLVWVLLNTQEFIANH